jgi:hypothetical protein
MKNTMHRGAMGSGIRLLVGVAATLALSLAFVAASASAKTVYEYVYSGTYFDGTGSTNGTFPQEAAGLAYDAHQERFLVGVGANPSYISKFTKAGAPSPFSGTGLSSATSTENGEHGFSPQVAVDQSGGATEGNIYIAGNVYANGFTPDGNPFPPGFSQYFESVCGVAVDPEGHAVVSARFGFTRFNPDGSAVPVPPTQGEGNSFGIHRPFLQADAISYEGSRGCFPAIDSNGDIYSNLSFEGFIPDRIVKTDPYGKTLFELTKDTPRGIAIDPSNDEVFVLEGNQSFSQYNSAGSKLGGEWGKAEGSYLGLQFASGIAVDPETHSVWILNRREYAGGVRRVERFDRANPINVPDTRVIQPALDNPLGTTAVLKGIVNPGGTLPADKTSECRFEYGTAVEFNIGESFSSTINCSEGTEFTGTGDVSVSAEIPVVPTTRYYYRLSSKNGNGKVSVSGPRNFIAQGKPKLSSTYVDEINTDAARFNARIDPNSGNTTFHFEWGPPGEFTNSTPESAPFGYLENESKPGIHSVSRTILGLSPGQQYQYRVVTTNEAGAVTGPTQQFSTYLPDPGSDPCVNAEQRQQTEASLLPDCRAYELVSAANSGGNDVVTDLVPGKSPLAAYPRAKDRLLYSVDFGLLPDIEGSPTNFGLDPYVASRGEDAWTTKYLGLPADGMADDGAFGSPLLGADTSLQTFAFGGAGICDPCYEDNSINVPLRTPAGNLEKGMAGTSNPAADPAGEVRKSLSADGSHFVFGADKKFESSGKEGSVSIYDRNLQADTTQVVSTLENAATMGGEVGELDVSDNGSRILVGQRISADVKGNEYWHLYMHIGSSANSVDLTPGATLGALYDGMSGDGSRVFFTTKDKLLGTDTDVSSDIYEAAVDGGGTRTLRLITTKGGAASNDDSCLPAGIPDSWNTVSGEGGKCNAVAFAGGASVASGNGTFYFASPELLDGANGKQDQANLYLVKPGGDPEFVATIDTSEGTTPKPPAHPVVTTEFGGVLSTPAGPTVDQSNGDLYLAQFGSGKVTRFKPDGTPDNFTEGPGSGTNSIPGFTFGPFGAGMAQVAVDNSPGPANGRIYVVNGGFGSTKISVYSPGGALLTTLNGSGNANGGFGFACGVAVDQSDGSIYIGDYFARVWRYTPTGSTVTEADYSGGIQTGAFSSCGVAAAAGKVYVNQLGEEEVFKFQTTDFALGPPPSPAAIHLATGTTAVSTDPVSGDVYVDQGNHLSAFDSTGAPTLTLGTGQLSGSVGVAVNGSNHHVFATRSNTFVTEFGFELIPYAPIDNPAIVHGVQQSATHSYGDFQITPDGRFAVFNSDQPLTGFTTFGFGEVYRYDSVAPKLDCASCPKTGAVPTSSTSLSKFGAGVSDDGRVFFSTRESFTLRDTNDKLDVYEWSNGDLGLISTGIGQEDSGLTTVSANGVNAFFYTRETLSSQDENGSVYKIYVAREKGGFLFDPKSPSCAASDECHGAGSEIPPPPNINTQTGSPHRTVTQSSKCPKRKVRRHGRCVKKPHRHGRKKATRHG